MQEGTGYAFEAGPLFPEATRYAGGVVSKPAVGAPTVSFHEKRTRFPLYHCQTEKKLILSLYMKYGLSTAGKTTYKELFLF